MFLSVFNNVYDSSPKSKEVTWSEFIRTYSQHILATKKEDVAAISPAEWPANAKRRKEDVVRVHFAALDLDGVSEKTVEQIKSILEPHSFLAHSTWSHERSFKATHKWHLRFFVCWINQVDRLFRF